MPRPGTAKIDFYPDEEAQELLKTLPPNTRSLTLNNLVKAYLSPDLVGREEAESSLIEIIRRRNKTSDSKYAGSFTDTANLSHRVFVFLCKQHHIDFTRESARYGTLKFMQALSNFNIEPDGLTSENLMVQSAFFRTVGEMRFWQSQLSKEFGLRDGEVHIFSDKWKADHPPLEDGRVIMEIGTGTADQAISEFVYGVGRQAYLDAGQPFECRWLEDGEYKERQLTAE